MKKTFTLFVFVLLAGSLLFPCQVRAQAPDKMSYQAVIRDVEGKLVAGENVGMKISILQGTVEGTVVYTETRTPKTNANGLVTFEIGGEGATAVSGIFSAIDWSAGPYFIKTETDPSGGTNYTITGTSQVLSVPYAMHSRSSEILTGEITESQIRDLKNYITHETDPLFSAWDKSDGITVSENQISDLQNYISEETDPLFSAWDKSDGITVSENQISDLQNYISEENDPVFNAWDKSSGIEISEDQITDLQMYLTQEADPVFATSPVSGITATDVSNWNTAFGWGDHIDNSITNEIQTLSISGSDLTLSLGGGTVTIPGDNWGNQTAATDATLSGNGTTASPLGLAHQSASTGQVLKWDGSSWSPGSDLSGSTLWSEAGSNIYYNSGRVGIGTSSPATLLHLHGAPVTSRGQLSLSAPSGEGSFLSFYEANEFKAYLWYDVSDDDLRLQNFTAGDLNLNPYGGKVGIGTNTPGYTLDVSGNINFTGTFTQNGNPFAISWTNLTGTPTTLEGYGITDAVKNTLDINFINSVQKGDKVLTTGGLYGRITDVEENFVRISVEGVILRVHKKALRRPDDY